MLILTNNVKSNGYNILLLNYCDRITDLITRNHQLMNHTEKSDNYPVSNRGKETRCVPNQFP